MHGLGNDYIYVNCLQETIDNPSEVARTISDRHFGIGSDGLIMILPSSKADFKMRMFNPDGTEGSCSACHSRHAFSASQARNPDNCGKCHKK